MTEQQTRPRNDPAAKLHAIMSAHHGNDATCQCRIGRKIDAALREQTRITVERVRERIEALDYRHQDDHVVLRWIDIAPILDEVVALPRTPGEEASGE